VFHRAHARQIQQLAGRAVLAIPAIIRNIDEHLRSVGGELAHLIRKNFFVANKSPQHPAAALKNAALFPWDEVADVARKFIGKSKKPLEWNIFAEGHEMHFVVTGGPVY